MGVGLLCSGVGGSCGGKGRSSLGPSKLSWVLIVAQDLCFQIGPSVGSVNSNPRMYPSRSLYGVTRSWEKLGATSEAQGGGEAQSAALTITSARSLVSHSAVAFVIRELFDQAESHSQAPKQVCLHLWQYSDWRRTITMLCRYTSTKLRAFSTIISTISCLPQRFSLFHYTACYLLSVLVGQTRRVMCFRQPWAPPAGCGLTASCTPPSTCHLETAEFLGAAAFLWALEA